MHQYRITGRGEIEVVSGNEDRQAVPQVTLEFSGDFQGNDKEVARLLCFLLDGLTIRSNAGLPEADWVEVGSDDDYDEDKDMYAVAYDEGYDEGFRDGSAAAFEMLGDVDQDSEEDEEDDDDNYY